MNTHSFIPHLYDVRFDGCYSLATVLAYHKSIEANMPQDGLVWAIEHPKTEVLLKRKADLITRINELVGGMTGQPYGVWTILDKEAHVLRCRLQLVIMALEHSFAKAA